MTSRSLKSIAVYCGSNVGSSEAFGIAARALGCEIAKRGLVLVYGGAHTGLMGTLADAALDAGGKVHGVIAESLFKKGHLHSRLTTHEVTIDRKSRRARMLQLADACIALPGGIGTLEEFMEAWTLNQHGEIDKPVGLLNVDDFYSSFLTFIDDMVALRFLPAEHRVSLVVAASANSLIDGLSSQPPITASKWMG
jgi:uncharacterized protein (TIGR00730 family)